VNYFGVWTRAQFAAIQRSTSDGTQFIAALLDPGFDTAPLRTGTPITVAGHSAYYLSQGPQSYGWIGAALVAWQRESGSWAVVGGPNDQDSLFRIAAIISTGPTQRLKAPYTLGYLPKDLAVFGVRTSVGNGDSGVSLGRYAGTGSEENAITINCYSVNQAAPPQASLQVVGRPAMWTATNDGGSQLSVYFDGFEVDMVVDKSRNDSYPQEELIRIAEGMRFAVFRNQATWLDPRG
jgi:hypothetical protein